MPNNNNEAPGTGPKPQFQILITTYTDGSLDVKGANFGPVLAVGMLETAKHLILTGAMNQPKEQPLIEVPKMGIGRPLG